jgi:hypothetical protein
MFLAIAKPISLYSHKSNRHLLDVLIWDGYEFNIARLNIDLNTAKNILIYDRNHIPVSDNKHLKECLLNYAGKWERITPEHKDFSQFDNTTAYLREYKINKILL